MTKKNIAFISVARSDFGRLYPTMQCIDKSPDYHLRLIVSGNHNSSKFGSSLKEITDSGLEIAHKIDLSSEEMAQVSLEISSELNDWFKKEKPDCFVILGDRYEMLAAAQTVFLNEIPIIHIGGGYQTSGAIDDKIRHSISQLSTYHFTASERCRQRVVELIGSEDNVYLSGAPDLEILENTKVMTEQEFYESCNLKKGSPFVLVTVHPETLKSAEQNKEYLENFKHFLCSLTEQVLITAPCADPGADLVFEMIDQLRIDRPDTIYIEALGMRRYVAAMKYAEMMIGNSSSGIIESASMGIPVLNVGDRQGGRECSENVIHSSYENTELTENYKLLKDPEFKKMSLKTKNIYGSGDFSEQFCYFLNISL